MEIGEYGRKFPQFNTRGNHYDWKVQVAVPIATEQIQESHGYQVAIQEYEYDMGMHNKVSIFCKEEQCLETMKAIQNVSDPEEIDNGKTVTAKAGASDLMGAPSDNDEDGGRNGDGQNFVQDRIGGNGSMRKHNHLQIGNDSDTSDDNDDGADDNDDEHSRDSNQDNRESNFVQNGNSVGQNEIKRHHVPSGNAIRDRSQSWETPRSIEIMAVGKEKTMSGKRNDCKQNARAKNIPTRIHIHIHVHIHTQTLT